MTATISSSPQIPRCPAPKKRWPPLGKPRSLAASITPRTYAAAPWRAEECMTETPTTRRPAAKLS